MATDLFVQPTDPTCETFLPYVWINLGPGEVWQEVADLSGCPPEMTGHYALYGYITNGIDTTRKLQVSDGVVLTFTDLTTGQLYVFEGTEPDAKIATHGIVNTPTKIQLDAVNTNAAGLVSKGNPKKSVTNIQAILKVRFVWIKLPS